MKTKIYNVGGICNLLLDSEYYGICFINEVWRWVEPQECVRLPSEDIYLDYYMSKCPTWATWVESNTRKQAINISLNILEAWMRLQ